MDWLKGIVNFLPLEQLSDVLGEIVIWWSQLVQNVPADDLPMYAYLGGAIIVLLLWILVARIMPKPLGGMSWMVLFAVLLAPGTALGDQGQIAPASIGVVYAIMMKDIPSAVNSALPILVVLVVGLFVGFVWQLIRGAFESSIEKARKLSAEDTQASMQLAGGNYIAQTPIEEVADKKPLPFAMLKKKATGKKTPEVVLESQDELQSKVIVDDKLQLEPVNDNKPTRKPVEGFYKKSIIKDSNK